MSLKTCKFEDKSRPYKLQCYWDHSEYWGESWILEETCCYSDFSERPSANAGVKNPSKSYNIFRRQNSTDFDNEDIICLAYIFDKTKWKENNYIGTSSDELRKLYT